QPEFTQLDLEMSFVDVEDVLTLTEGLFTAMFEELATQPILQKPFPRLTYAEAILRYGTDKPDLRFGMEIADVTDLVADSEFGVFSNTARSGGVIRGIAVPGQAGISRGQIDQLTEQAQSFGAKGLVWIGLLASDDRSPTPRSPIAKFLSEAEIRGMAERLGAGPGDLMLLVADQAPVAANVLGRLRVALGHQLGLVNTDVHAFCWIVEMPFFEWDEENGRWEAAHHPFTSPMDEDLEILETDPGRARAKAYDIVLDGWELGSGSIRIHRRDVQNKIFELMGYDEEEIERRFGHLLRAFEYGAPPHGGIAPGIDRTVMILAGEENIREVIAFP